MIQNPSLEKYPKLKFSERLKDENWGSVKGQVFLFIVVANELGLAADYKGMETDFGVKEKIQYFNDKLDSIINKKTGHYWEDDYAGFDAILEKAKIAKPFLAMVNPSFTKEAAELLDEVLKSHIPATSGAAIKKDEPIVIPEVEGTPTFAMEGETAEQLKKRIEKEDAANEEEEESNEDLLALLDEPDAGSELEEDDEEEEDESSDEKNNLELNKLLD